MLIDAVKLLAGLQELLAGESTNPRRWLVRTRHGRYLVTRDAGVRAAADWWISRAAYGDLAWEHDLTAVDLTDLDQAARVAEVVAAYVPAPLRGRRTVGQLGRTPGWRAGGR